jgi:hypothetical protein
MNIAHVRTALASYETVLEPDRNEPEWWAGAPSVVRAVDGAFYLAARMREGNSPRGKRGYEIRILRSDDGVRFTPVKRITREDAGVTGFERPALVQDQQTGLFRLYGCCGTERGWVILRFEDAADPAAFDPRSARTVLSVDGPDNGFARVTGYKDPVVYRDGALWHLFVIATDRVERIGHFVSADGDSWVASPRETVLENTGWHSFFTRPASVLPLAVGYLFVYEGSSLQWRDPVYNIATGLAYSLDLESFVDLTPDAPLVTSHTPGAYHTWRYSDWLVVGNSLHVYAEAARPNNTNEIRVSVLPLDAVVPD